MTAVLILAGSEPVAKRIGSVPSFDVTTVEKEIVAKHARPGDIQTLVRHDDGAEPDIVVLGDALSIDEALSIAQLVDHDMPAVELVLVSDPDTDLALRAMRVGVREILSPSISDDELSVLLHRASGTAAARLSGGGTAPVEDSTVVVVMSAKGGVGKSTVATNLAVSLARLRPMEVVLVDLDSQFGDVATLLDLEPHNTVSDAIDSIATSDTVLLKTFLTPHASGLLALAAPSSPADGDRIRADDARDLLRLLATLFPIIVVDTAAGMTGATLGALEVADELVIVTSMEVTSLRAVRKEIEVLDQLGLATSSRHLVLNQTGRKSGLSRRDVEASVGMPVATTLLHTEEALLAANQGQPLVLQKKPGPMAKALNTLAARIGTATAAPAAGRRKQSRSKKTRGGGAS